MGTPSLSLQVKAGATGSYSNTLSDASAPSVNVGDQITKALANGSGLNQVERWWQSKDRSLADGVSENIDLFDLGALDIGNGGGRDQLGLQLQATKLVYALIINNSQEEGANLLVGGEGSAAAWNSLFNASDDAEAVIGPFGGHIQVFNPSAAAYEIADTSNHLLKMLADGGDVTYTIYLGFRD